MVITQQIGVIVSSPGVGIRNRTDEWKLLGGPPAMHCAWKNDASLFLPLLLLEMRFFVPNLMWITAKNKIFRSARDSKRQSHTSDGPQKCYPAPRLPWIDSESTLITFALQAEIRTGPHNCGGFRVRSLFSDKSNLKTTGSTKHSFLFPFVFVW